MNKLELVDHIATEAELTKVSAAAALEAVLDGIDKTLKKGEEVRLVGFGTFSVRERAAGKGRNPATGKEIKIAASKNARFKPGAALKASLNKKVGQEVRRSRPPILCRCATRAKARQLEGRARLRNDCRAGNSRLPARGARFGYVLATPPVAWRGKRSRVCATAGRAVSSVGRASRLHREGRRFEPVTAHQSLPASASLCGVILPFARTLGVRRGAARLDDLSGRAARVARSCGARCPACDRRRWRHRAERPRRSSISSSRAATTRSCGAIVFFNSRGGNVVASMVFGHILRELRVAGDRRPVRGRRRAGPYVGECLSACVYAMMGAVRRIAPPGSEVALHRMSIVESEAAAGAGRRTSAQLRRRADGRCPAGATRGGWASIRRWCSGGISAAGLVHVLTPEEMRRWSFATSQF